MPSLRRRAAGRPAEGEVGDEQRHREADAAPGSRRRRSGASRRPPAAASPAATASQAASSTPDRLADQQPERHAQRHRPARPPAERRRRGRRRRWPARRAGTIRKVTQACRACSSRLQRRLHALAGVLQLLERVLLLPVGQHRRSRPVAVAARSGRAARRRGRRRSAASIRRRAGMVRASSTPATVAWTPDWRKASPQPDAEQQVDSRAADAEQVERRPAAARNRRPGAPARRRSIPPV